MATITTLLIIMANCVMLYFSSFLAAGGDGSARGVWTVQIVGFAWVAFASSFALSRCTKGKGSTGVVIALSTLPVGFFATFIAATIWSVGQGILVLTEPVPNEVADVCKRGGPRYLASPATPVHSISFDWKTSLDRGRFSYVNRNPSKFGRFRFLDQIDYPQTVHFIEERFRSGYGVRQEDRWPFMRKPNGGVFVGVAESTADALVTYEITKLSKVDAKNIFEMTDITVIDRRDGRVLASLQYPTDGNNFPLCGETSPGEVNTAEFIFKAVGATPN
jgi:hypothetical protein